MMNRAEFLTLFQTALSAQSYAFAVQICQDWLAQLPGDLVVQRQQAQAYLAAGQHQAAWNRLQQLVMADPEDAVAQHLLAQVAQARGQQQLAAIAAGIATVRAQQTGQTFSFQNLPPAPGWLPLASRAEAALAAQDFATARNLAEQLLVAQLPNPYPALLLLRSHWQAGNWELVLPLAQGFWEQYPDCVAIQLSFAQALLVQPFSSSAQAVELLHQAARRDALGVVVSRHWGKNHPVWRLLPPVPTFQLNTPLPSAVAQVRGWNQLPPAADLAAYTAVNQPTTPPVTELPPAAQPTPTSPSKAAAAQPKSNKAGTPVHLILTSRSQLQAKYGKDQSSAVLGWIQQLAAARQQMLKAANWVILADDAACMAQFGLKPVDPKNAWQIKIVLQDVATWLAYTKGLQVQSLLIVGNAEIVPFHHLPNPTDDQDLDVPSDNPYGSLDDNYFLTEWAIGRLPSPVGQDAGPLLRLLQASVAAHQSPAQSKTKGAWKMFSPNQFIQLIRAILQQLMPSVGSAPPAASLKPGNSWGYSAEIWKAASLEVFGRLGKAQSLQSCPPQVASGMGTQVGSANLLYFNLHGLADSPDWFGQRAAGSTWREVYPLALRPSDLPQRAPENPAFVFSEACYGANILGKPTVNDAMCLRFLDSGALAFVGSTKIAYGSVAAPLISADLLASLFWQQVLAGQQVGNALRLAKQELTQLMQQRQGFLDGEDQKTLLSFVLYGDPLLCLPQSLRSNMQQPMPPANPTKQAKNQAKAVQYTAPSLPDSPETIRQVKNLVCQYLPDMRESEVISVTEPMPNRVVPSAAERLGLAKNPTSGGNGYQVYTLRRAVQYTPAAGAKTLQGLEYARVTISKNGEVLKLAVTK